MFHGVYQLGMVLAKAICDTVVSIEPTAIFGGCHGRLRIQTAVFGLCVASAL
ncbi:MAG: hypothetical protein F6K62_26210 [Sphaerospermopsis sp. SIO1G2]|nr:hypothetical protein [Sphaerospermopsis sp. SIO1G2]